MPAVGLGGALCGGGAEWGGDRGGPDGGGGRGVLSGDERVALLAGAAFAPLERYRAEIAARFGDTPHVDPHDGGTAARLLILLETPGARGMTLGGTAGEDGPQFVSCDNPTGTARNLRRFLREAGIERRDVLLWNAVPWVIHAPGARNRPPRTGEVSAGVALLPGFVGLLPRLRGVVMSGRVAQRAEATLRRHFPGLALFAMPHPSPTIVNTSPAIGARIAAALAEAAALCRDGVG